MIRTGKQRDRQTVRFYQIDAMSSYQKKKWKPRSKKEKKREKPHRSKPEEQGVSILFSGIRLKLQIGLQGQMEIHETDRCAVSHYSNHQRTQ
jgi:hypothetical protein